MENNQKESGMMGQVWDALTTPQAKGFYVGAATALAGVAAYSYATTGSLNPFAGGSSVDPNSLPTEANLG